MCALCNFSARPCLTRSRTVRFALARRRRDRNGEHPRPRDLAALRAVLADPKAKSYELSYLRSNTMPQSPFGTPLVDKYRPTVGIPGTCTLSTARRRLAASPARKARRWTRSAISPCCRKVGRQERISRRQGDILRRLYAEGGQALAGLAVAEARYREGAADRHHGGAARRQDPSRQGQAMQPARSSPPRTSRRC